MHLLDEQLDHYRENGFLLIENYFSKSEIELLVAESKGMFARDSVRRILEKSGAVRSVFAPHFENSTFETLSRLPRLIEPAKQILGSDVYVHQFKINAKVALDGDQWEWHQDFLYWQNEDGMRSPRVITAAIFLQEVNEFNGPMLVIPGSHKDGVLDVSLHQHSLGTHREASTQHKEPSWLSTLTANLKYKIDKDVLSSVVAAHSIVSIKGRAGLLMFFHGNLLHASSNNLSPYDRLCIFVTFNSVENKLAEVPNPRPAFIANRDFSPLVPVADDALLRRAGATK